LIGTLISNTKASRAPRCGATSTMLGRLWLKAYINPPPGTRMKLLHSNIWWSDMVDLISKGFTYAKGLNHIGKTFNVLLTFGVVVVMHLSMRSAQNTMGTRGTPE
jgi:hypothetical protein